MIQAIHVLDRRKKEIGMSTAELCRIANIPEATYRNMLTGRSLREPFDTIRSLSLALNMTLDDLTAAMDDAPAPNVVEAVSQINETPATTKELDTALSILTRTLEGYVINHQADIRTIAEHLERVVAAFEQRLERAIASRDAQFELERTEMRDRIRSQAKWLTGMFALCGVLFAAICLLLMTDGKGLI